MKLMYVFNAREADGYIVRVPEFLARIICRFGKGPLDYASSPEGC